MFFSNFKITVSKILMVSLILFSGVLFAEDVEEIESSENQEVVENENNAEEQIENEEPAEIDSVEREQSYESEEPVQSYSDGMDEQEREHAQKIEELEAAYARDRAEQNSDQSDQQSNESNNSGANENPVRTKRNKSLKELDRSQREGRRTKRERTSPRANDMQTNQKNNPIQNNNGKSTYVSEKKTDTNPENFVCDPIVSLQIQNQLRFDILKELANEYGFEITILESENKLMSIEKNLPLSKVIESITRDMSVVLNFKKIKDCDRLIAIDVLDNNEWGGSGGGSSSDAARSDISEKLQRYKPKFQEPKLIDAEDVEPYTDEQLNAQKMRQEERKAKRLEEQNVRSLNDELENGADLKTQFNVKGDSWKKNINETKVDIPDMEQYVQEVLDGERQPDLRKMSLKQRSEYMKLRRELRTQQAE